MSCERAILLGRANHAQDELLESIFHRSRRKQLARQNAPPIEHDGIEWHSTHQLRKHIALPSVGGGYTLGAEHRQVTCDLQGTDRTSCHEHALTAVAVRIFVAQGVRHASTAAEGLKTGHIRDGGFGVASRTNDDTIKSLRINTAATPRTDRKPSGAGSVYFFHPGF